MPLAVSHRAKAIVEALGGTWRGTRGECRCPAHDDHGPSLSVRLGERADDLADRALAELTALVAEFIKPDHPYTSRLRPRMDNARYEGDYDHLARVREWSLTESAEDIAMMGPGPP